MDRHSKEGLPGFHEMIARGEAHCKSGGIDYPDTGFEETQWLPQDKGKWTDWMELDEQYVC